VVATIAVYTTCAGIICAGVIVVAIVRADADLSASAEPKATSSTRITGNIKASGDDERIEDGAELREIGGKEGRLDTGNGGGNSLDFTGNGLGNTDGETEDSGVVDQVDDWDEVGSIRVRSSISHDDEHSRNTGSSGRHNLIVGQFHTAVNASRSSSLAGSIHGIEEGELIVGEGDDQSSGGGKISEPHLNVLRSKGVRVGDILTKSFDLSEGSGIDTSRFIKNEEEIDLLVALLLGA